MRAMNQRKMKFARAAHAVVPPLFALALSACGGGGKGADSPGNCPEGTMLKGSDCIPTASSGPVSDDATDPPVSHSSGSSGSSSSSSSAASDPSPAPAGGKTAYDKDAVEV